MPTATDPQRAALYRSVENADLRASRMQFAGQERRRSARTVANVPGTATFANGRQVACTVIDQSDTGAKLTFSAIGLLPERFDLAFGVRKARAVKVVWRRDAEVGVAFI